MNIREIKLAITVGLMNSGNYLNTIQDLMQHLTEQVGAFIGQQVLQIVSLDQDRSVQTVALRYENCTLNIDLVQNNTTHDQYVNRFEVY